MTNPNGVICDFSTIKPLGDISEPTSRRHRVLDWHGGRLIRHETDGAWFTQPVARLN
jgi:hypothetical protein